MTPQDLHALAFGFLSGALILMTGVGAGVIVVPGLIALFGMPPSLAIGTASAFSVLTKVMAGLSHMREGNVSKPLSLSFGKIALPATVIAALLVNGLLQWLPDARGSIQLSLKVAVVLAASCAMALMFLPALNQAMRGSGPYFLPTLCGTLVGATGVGGGVLIVPSLMTLSTESVKRVVGTSVVLGLVLSIATGLVYGAAGALSWRVALLMTAGAMVAMPIAGRLFKRASENQVRILSAALIAISISAMLIDIVTRR